MAQGRPSTFASFAVDSRPGIADTHDRCRGEIPAIPIESGSARSCCSRPPSRRLFRISNASLRDFPRSRFSRLQKKRKCFASGKGWDITAGPATFTRRPGASSQNTAAPFPTQCRRFANFPVSDATRPAQSPRLHSIGPRRSWKPTHCGCTRACLAFAEIPGRPPARNCCGNLRGGSFRARIQGSSIRP